MANKRDNKKVEEKIETAQNAVETETAQNGIDMSAFIEALFKPVGQTAQVPIKVEITPDSELYRAASIILRCTECRKSTTLAASMVYGALLVKPLTNPETQDDWNDDYHNLISMSDTRFRKVDYILDTINYSDCAIRWKRHKELVIHWEKQLEIFEKTFKGQKDFETARTAVVKRAQNLISQAGESLFGAALAPLFNGGALSDRAARDIAIFIAEKRAPLVHENNNVRAKYYSSHTYKWKDLKYSEIIDASLKVCGQLKETEYIPKDVFNIWNQAVNALTQSKTDKTTASINSDTITNDMI